MEVKERAIVWNPSTALHLGVLESSVKAKRKLGQRAIVIG